MFMIISLSNHMVNYATWKPNLGIPIYHVPKDADKLNGNLNVVYNVRTINGF